MATAVLEEDIGFEPLPSASDDLGFEPTQSAPATPLQKLAPMTAAVVSPGIGELRRREGAGEIAAGITPTEHMMAYYGSGAEPTLMQPFFSDRGSKDRAAEEARRGAQATAPLRYGVPAAAALAFPPSAAGIVPALVSGAAVGGASALGETAAQGVELATGERQEMQPGRIAGAGVLGATPFAGPVRGLAGPVSAAFQTAVKQAAVNEGTYALSRLWETVIDEGRLPTVEEITKAATEPLNYLPAVIGAGAGGVQGFLSRPAQRLTQEQTIAQQGQAARGRLEAATGQPAPLTGTQQTGRNIPGEFGATSGEVAAQQAVPENVRNALGIQPNPAGSLAAEQELVAAGNAASGRLRNATANTQAGAQRAVEDELQTSMPGSARAQSIQEAAQTSQASVRAADARLSAEVDNAYNAYRGEVQRLTAGQDPANFRVTLNNSQRAADEILATLASREVTDAAGNVTRVPAEFFEEASRRAESIRNISQTPQSVDQIIGLRQAIDDLQSYATEVAPGFGRRQLGQLRTALKQDELAAARSLGGRAERLLVDAQGAAQRRFQMLEDNPGILKLLRNPSERGAFQNPEQIYDALGSQPELLESVRRLVTPQEFQQVRRGLFDSLRHPTPVEINGIRYEDAGSLANNFRRIPQSAKVAIAGTEARANSLQSILDDANRVQNAGRQIPVSGGISESAINDIAENAAGINMQALRQNVLRDANQAAENSRRYYNATVERVRNRTFNPDIEPDRFVRDFLLRSNNVNVVDDAMNQLTPAVAEEVRHQAARVFLDAAIDASGSARRLEHFAGDRNRMEIARRIIDPADFRLIEDFTAWSRARNITASGGRLEPNRVATAVWRVTRARFVIDSLLGSAAAQDFMSTVSRAPGWLARVRPNMTVPEATALANSVKIPLNTLVAEWNRFADESDKVRESLPENQRAAFDESLGVPQPPK